MQPLTTAPRGMLYNTTIQSMICICDIYRPIIGLCNPWRQRHAECHITKVWLMSSRALPWMSWKTYQRVYVIYEQRLTKYDCQDTSNNARQNTCISRLDVSHPAHAYTRTHYKRTMYTIKQNNNSRALMISGIQESFWTFLVPRSKYTLKSMVSLRLHNHFFQLR